MLAVFPLVSGLAAAVVVPNTIKAGGVVLGNRLLNCGAAKKKVLMAGPLRRVFLMAGPLRGGGVVKG